MHTNYDYDMKGILTQMYMYTILRILSIQRKTYANHIQVMLINNKVEYKIEYFIILKETKFTHTVGLKHANM